MFSFILLRALLPVLASSDGTTACTIWNNEDQASSYHPAISNASSRPADSSLKQLILGQVWKAPSSSTAAYPPTINQPTQPMSLCGLGGCATTQTTNPFNFFVQVSKSCSLFSKKTSNYFLIQLPSPQCCVVISIECFHVIRSLLLQSGDIETNPGPDTNAILAELKKLSTGQSKLLAEVQDLKTQLLTTDKAISDLSGRMTALENHYQNLAPVRTELENVKIETAQTARLVCGLEARFDDAENHSRRNNLIFYGIPNSTGPETFAQSEQLVIRHCRDHLNITIDPKEIERAHRLGHHTSDRPRPVIVKFTFYKTKDTILSNGRKFKGTSFSVGEDFSRPVQNARKHLLAFAKSKNTPFSLRFKTLLMGPKRYIFDEPSQTVRETA
ncbi:uncharacterized protein LOC120837076 [Ixodes scapularis]|uniref:uncharacterized protein LOC120837076 n=1 Tax=Ixodes scapularis TaxID=6945 RepID=UPI001A9CD12B|nr:uncharacterized protein LOC120837076 [Ixodes scapularis]